jgi:signal transduction histidine kinase
MTPTRPTPRSTPAGAPRSSALKRRGGAGRPAQPSSPASADAYGEIANAVITLDSKGKILSVNPTAERILGHGAAAVLGRPLSAFVRDVAGSYDVVCELVTDRRGSLVVLLRDATERKRADAAMREIAEIGHDLGATHDPEEITGRIVGAVLRLFAGRRSFLYQRDRATGELVCVATAGAGRREQWIGRRLSSGAGVAGLSVAQGHAIWSPDVLADVRFTVPGWERLRFREEGYQSAVGVPLGAGPEIVGALVVATAADRVFTEDDLRLLSLFAAHAAVAIRNADLLRESERRRGVAERLAEVSRVVSQSLDPAEVARRIADSVFTLFDAKVSTLFRLEPSSMDLVALAVSGDVGEEFGPTLVFPHGTGVTGLAVRERQAVVTPDLLADPRVTLTPEIRAAIQRAPYRAVLAVPLLAKDSVVGALGIGDRAGRAFDDEEIQLAQAFAAQAAVALENSRLHEELHRALQTVEASQQRLVETERLRASRDLAAGVAHHLNNILMVVLGRLQLLLRKVDASEIRRDLEAVEQAARNGADVIQRLLGFTEARPLVPTVPVDLNQLAQQALEMTRSQWRDEAQARGIQIQVQLEPGDIPAVAGQPTELQEVLRNLLFNAIEALPSGGCITVRTWASDDSVLCSVADSGAAMSEEARRRALEPFFTTKEALHLGLGLSVAYGIVHRHGGWLDIESAEGGTVATVRLPAGRAAR